MKIIDKKRFYAAVITAAALIGAAGVIAVSAGGGKGGGAQISQKARCGDNMYNKKASSPKEKKLLLLWEREKQCIPQSGIAKQPILVYTKSVILSSGYFKLCKKGENKNGCK